MKNATTGLDTARTETLLERNRAVPIPADDLAELLGAAERVLGAWSNMSGLGAAIRALESALFKVRR